MLAKQREKIESCSGVWCRFHDSHPEYLARHYWWAYLWRWGVWFFDHQPIINAILFGQYRRLSQRALHDCMRERPEGRMLQLTCAYGSMTPSLLKVMDDELYLMDVAEIQLSATRKKLTDVDNKRLLCARMNAESLAYADDAFATVLIFFLLHELPPDARERTISEAIRVLRPGGRFVITEYGACPEKNLLWRLPLTRFMLQRLEPFLASYWQVDLLAILDRYARTEGKLIRQVDEFHCFADFYRVSVFELEQ
ncbi:MAG: methyltransferase domain-containing protein [Gammaproteobacteria bacterium]|nr:methyltransferase domain-containing protein [Gammaproteobacteria bacterium]